MQIKKMKFCINWIYQIGLSDEPNLSIKTIWYVLYMLLVLEVVCVPVSTHVTLCEGSECSQFLANAVSIHTWPAVAVPAGKAELKLSLCITRVNLFLWPEFKMQHSLISDWNVLIEQGLTLIHILSLHVYSGMF